MTVGLADVAVFTTAAVALIFIYYHQRRRRYLLPPGPKGLPIIGNILDIPETKQWIKYAQWSQDYGSPVIYLNALVQDIVVINDYETAQEAFEKRADIYSNRPRLPMLVEALATSWSFALQSVSEKWKVCRHEFDIRFRQGAARQFRPHTTRMTLQLLGRLLTTPDDFKQHFKYMTGSFILDFAYGIRVEPENDKYLGIVTRGSEGMDNAGNKNIIDILPWVQHIPSWLPGMGWKKQVDLWREDCLALYNAPYDHVKEQLKNGTARSCIATDMLSKMETVEQHSNAEWEDVIKSICGTAFVAASETTIAALHTLVLMMALFPDIQQKAQAQIDRVVGKTRLPEFSDQGELPYITAITRELLRYHPVLPFALPHATAKDDILRGYHIPKGAIVLGNSWAMLHNPTIYPEPEKFKPERFLNPDGSLNSTVRSPEAAFGFGKRLCPGRFTALDTIWIVSACLLAAFDFTKPKDLNIELGPDLFTSGFVSHPLPFKCIIKP